MAKTREELLLKRRELQNQIEALDRVLEMFPANSSTPQRGNGRYANMSMASAMVDYLGRVQTPVVVAEIAKALKEQGVQSDSPNFTTIISSVGNGLVKRGKLVRKTKNKRKAFAVPTKTE